MRTHTLRGLGLVGQFSPWDSSKWPVPLHAVWASDPLWTNPGDGGAVDAWRNHSGGGDPAQSTAAAKPTFRASTAAFGGRPTVQFDGGDQLLVDTTDIAQSYKMVCVAQTTVAATAQAFMGTSGGSFRLGTTTTASLISCGTTLAAAGYDQNPHIYQATCNGASSALLKDGTSVATGNAGTGAHINFALGCASAATSRMTGHIHFAAIYAGATADADLLALMRAFGVFCGITVA